MRCYYAASYDSLGHASRLAWLRLNLVPPSVTNLQKEAVVDTPSTNIRSLAPYSIRRKNATIKERPSKVSADFVSY